MLPHLFAGARGGQCLGGALASASLAADLRSGPQVGEDVPGPFHPLNVNGEDAGKKACLYCNGGRQPRGLHAWLRSIGG